MLGFVLRQLLIHEVRREYEGIVDSIQSPELLQRLPLSLANEAIHWPHENILCFPLFTSQEEGLCEPCHSDQDTAPQSTTKHIEGEQKTNELLSPLNIPTSTPNHSPQQLDRTKSKDAINSPIDNTPHYQGHDDKQQFDESSLSCLIEPLPRDREALLELRSQLSLELLWIKQAIASRQEVRQCSTKITVVCTHYCTNFNLLQYLQLKQQFQNECSVAE